MSILRDREGSSGYVDVEGVWREAKGDAVIVLKTRIRLDESWEKRGPNKAVIRAEFI